MVELNEKALEAACRAWINSDSPMESGIRDAVRAYLSALPEEVVFCPNCGWNSAMDGKALPAPDDGLEARKLVDRIAHKEQISIWANEIATAISLGDFLKDDWSFDDSVDLEMEIVAQLREIIRSAFTHPELDICATLQSKDEQIERLTRERDEALTDPYKVMGGIYEKWKARAVDAEQQVQKLTAENERLREATKESSRLLKDLDLGRSIHNSRFPQQNIDGPLWAQIPRICEIARSALETQEGGK